MLSGYCRPALMGAGGRPSSPVTWLSRFFFGAHFLVVQSLFGSLFFGVIPLDCSSNRPPVQGQQAKHAARYAAARCPAPSQAHWPRRPLHLYLQMSTFLFTSESVNEGHPDKLCDQVRPSALKAACVLLAALNDFNRGL